MTQNRRKVVVFIYPQWYNKVVENTIRVSYPVLCVAVSRANNASSFLDHLEDGAAVNVAHNIGIIWPHDPAVKRRLVSIGCGSDGRITTLTFISICNKISRNPAEKQNNTTDQLIRKSDQLCWLIISHFFSTFEEREAENCWHIIQHGFFSIASGANLLIPICKTKSDMRERPGEEFGTMCAKMALQDSRSSVVQMGSTLILQNMRLKYSRQSW